MPPATGPMAMPADLTPMKPLSRRPRCCGSTISTPDTSRPMVQTLSPTPAKNCPRNSNPKKGVTAVTKAPHSTRALPASMVVLAPYRSRSRPAGIRMIVRPRAWAVTTCTASPAETSKDDASIGMVGNTMPCPRLMSRTVLYSSAKLPARAPVIERGPFQFQDTSRVIGRGRKLHAGKTRGRNGFRPASPSEPFPRRSGGGRDQGLEPP